MSDATVAEATTPTMATAIATVTAEGPSEATILARTLLKLHWRTLVKSGILRLANTLVQVAPPLLVASFLRSLEAAREVGLAAAGVADPHMMALRTALLLYASLNVKTVIENQVRWVSGWVQVRVWMGGAVE